MSYAPKHAKPTSLMDAVLGGRHEPSAPAVTPPGRHAPHDSAAREGAAPGSAAHGAAAQGGKVGVAAVAVPKPRKAAHEQASQPAW